MIKTFFRLGAILQTPFGDLWSFSSTQPDSVSDSAYSQEELRPHNDGTYFSNSPGSENKVPILLKKVWSTQDSAFLIEFRSFIA